MGGRATPPAVPTAADAVQLQQENRKLSERLQKIEVEKALLKDLVDKAYGADDDGGSDDGAAAARKGLLDWQADKAEMTAQLDAAVEAQRKAEKNATMQTKRAAVFEAEVTRLQQDLREADDLTKQLRAASADRDDVADKLARTTAELESTRETVEALMAKVSDADKRKAQTERDLTAIVEKTANATNDTQVELSAKSMALSQSQQEVARLRAVVGKLESQLADANERGGQAEETSEQLQAAEEKATALETQLADLQAKYDEACQECESLHTALDSEEASAAAMRKTMDEMAEQVKSMKAEGDKVRTKLVATQSELVEFKDEFALMQDERNSLEHNVQELRADLASAHEDTDEARRELASAIESMERKKEDAAAEVEAMREQVNELTDKVADAEAAAELKLRVANTRVKELQAQLSKAGSQGAHGSSDGHGSSHRSSSHDLSSADVAGNTLHDENLRLIQRLASCQEQLWSLQAAKTAAEEECQRLSKQLSDKSAVIRAHFEETARRMPAGSIEKKKGGAFSLFSSSKDAEVASLMQSQLEEALSDKLQLHAANTELRNELNAAYEAIDRAVLMGFDPEAADDATPQNRATLDTPQQHEYHDDPSASPPDHHQAARYAAAADDDSEEEFSRPVRREATPPAGRRVPPVGTPRAGGRTPRMGAMGTPRAGHPSHLDGGDAFE